MTQPSNEILTHCFRIGRHWRDAPDKEYQDLMVDEIQRGAEPDPPMETIEISSNGITWELEAKEHGQYVNGDPWVVGPLSLVCISPPTEVSGERVKNGSMLNPRLYETGGQFPGSAQGYDSEMYAQYSVPGDFQARLCATRSMPLWLRAGDTLVSTVSHPSRQRPQLERAAVLTVVAQPPMEGEFRPSYCGRKTAFLDRDIDMEELKLIPPVGDTPSFREINRWFDNLWLEHCPSWIQRYQHPSKNMPDYGREIHDLTGIAGLMCLLDVPDDEKRPLLLNYLQLGIDLYGLAQSVREGARGRDDFQAQMWPGGAGHHNGRKWPILFAGLVLGEHDMVAICQPDSPVAFSEDDQTFFTTVRPAQGYTEPGLAEWGTGHFQSPERDDARWSSEDPALPGQTQTHPDVGYRRCCTANAGFGSALAAQLFPGGRMAWGNEAYFKYQSRYRETENHRPLPLLAGFRRRLDFEDVGHLRMNRREMLIAMGLSCGSLAWGPLSKPALLLPRRKLIRMGCWLHLYNQDIHHRFFLEEGKQWGVISKEDLGFKDHFCNVSIKTASGKQEGDVLLDATSTFVLHYSSNPGINAFEEPPLIEISCA